MKKVQINPDEGKNMLRIVLSGFFNDEEARQIFEKVKLAIDQLKPGFDAINDIRNFRPTTPKGAEIMGQAQQHAAEKGLRRVVRIVNTDEYDVGTMQFERTGRKFDIQVHKVFSVEEAEKLLEETN